MLLLLQDLKGDNFDIHEKFEKLWVDNCKDFKTVPAHVIELNVRNCASFEFAPDTVKNLTVENCPKYLTDQRRNKMQDADIINALNDVTMRDNKEKIFIEVLNLRAYVARLRAELAQLIMAKVDELENKINS